MPPLSEIRAVEAPVADWLSKMGWTLRSAEDLKVHRRALANPVIEPILVERIAALNGIDTALARQVADTLLQHLNHPDPLVGNEKFLELLRTGVTVAVGNESPTFRVIDFDNISRNDFTVTRQYWVQGNELIKPDIVLLVNGIPLVCIEAKQRARKGTNYQEGVRQFSVYATKAPRLWAAMLYGVACNGRLAKYGVPGHSASYFGEWKDLTVDTHWDNPLMKADNGLCGTKYSDELGKPLMLDIDEIERMKRSLVGLLQPSRVLDMLDHFVVFENSPEGKVKKVARYQQLRAANRIHHRVAKTDLKQGVIWHTQGSGKSLTMLYTAYKLRTNPALSDPTVYIVVDRKDLREQLGGTFEDCEFPNTIVPVSIPQLKSLIEQRPGAVIITTIQKFNAVAGMVKLDDRSTTVVLIDEAHRSQYGDYQMELQAVLPNARRFAFTGTPIPRTHQEFGARDAAGKPEYYLDRYSIKDAIDDGATKEIRYTFGPVEYQLDKAKLKQGWDDIAAELTEEEKEAVQRRVRPWRTFLKNPERITILAADIAKDYREVLEPLGFKAQLVASDKEACVAYYDALLAHFDASEICVVFWQGHYDDQERYALYSPHYLSDVERKRTIRNFKRRLTAAERARGNNLKILIVCNMLLTGFDAPIEQTMYLDSPLRDHNLLQAVARTNRPYDDKETRVAKSFGRIVDYVGVFQNYLEALAYDPADIGDFPDVESLAKTFPDVLEAAMMPFSGVVLEDSYECSIAIVRMLSTLDQAEFEGHFHDVLQLWEAISPHPMLLDHRDRYRWLCEIYEIYLEEFQRLDFDAEIHAAKTRRLIHESTRLIKFRGHLPEVAIDSRYLDNLEATKLTPDDKAEKIIRDIETVIRLHESENPVYVELQERLERLIREKSDHAKSIEKLIDDLSALYGELDEVASLPERMGFAERGEFDVYMELKHALGDRFDDTAGRGFAAGIARLIKRKAYAGWQDNPQELKRIRTDIGVLALDDDFAALGIADENELMEAVLRRLIQHYGLD